MNIVHRGGRENQHADTLLHQPVMPAPTEDQKSYQEVQIARVATTKIPDKLDELLGQPPTSVSANTDDLTSHQLADPNLQPIILYLKDGGQQAQEMISLAKQFTILDEILYRESPKRGELPQIVVPASLKQLIMEETHAGALAGHFSGQRLYKIISQRWWWKNMYKDLMEYARNFHNVLLLRDQNGSEFHP